MGHYSLFELISEGLGNLSTYFWGSGNSHLANISGALRRQGHPEATAMMGNLEVGSFHTPLIGS